MSLCIGVKFEILYTNTYKQNLGCYSTLTEYKMDPECEEVDVHKFCRICFEQKAGLISSQKVLVIEDFTCTVEEILSLLSSQEVEADPTYPSKICSTCKELVEATFALKIMYEKTSEVLRNLLSPYEEIKIEEVKVEPEEPEDTDFLETFQNWEEETNMTNSQDCEENNVEPCEPEEEHIILKIEDDCSNEKTEPNGVMSRQEKRKLYQRKKRYMDKQRKLFLSAKIDKEIEETLNSSIIKLKKVENLSHLCPMCWIEVTDPIEFKQHVHSHNAYKKYFKAKPVSKKARFVAQPRDTVSIFNRPDALHWCPYCNENLPALKFGIHLWDHERLDDFYCEICDRVFVRLRDFNLHKVRSHREEYPFKCVVCNQGFVIKYNYDCHMLKHTTDEENYPYACEVCPRKFSNSIHLWRHMHIHNGKGVYGSQYKKYKCNICKQFFKTIDVYDHHIKRCSVRVLANPNGLVGKKPPSQAYKNEFKCHLCEKVFRTYPGVYQHIRNTHQKKLKRRVCEICGKSVYNVTYHMHSHTGQKPAPRICDVCGKSFSSVQNYLRHRKTLHTDHAGYLCDVCGKCFKHYDSFKMHERIHIGNKRHICPVCGKGFLEKSYMKKHLRTHDKNKAILFDF